MPGQPALLVTEEGELRLALQRLSSIKSGETVRLSRGPKHFISATRCGEFWSATVRLEKWWTLASFTAAFTSDYSAHQAQRSRAAGSLWKQIALTFKSPPAEVSLSSGQIATIFAEYFSGRRFTIPYAAA